MDALKIGLAQISPIWLNKKGTLDKVAQYTSEASENNVQLIVFGEALVPGYPFWLDKMNSATFNSSVQKEIHAHYMTQAVCIEEGHLDELCKLAKQKVLPFTSALLNDPKTEVVIVYIAL